MKFPKAILLAVALLAGAPAWSQTPPPATTPAGSDQPQTNWWSKPGTDIGMDGPVRLVWAAHKNPETRPA